ncbi:hypothetical protein [Novosphingobium sp.]|uniref:hypothetical protein n=1 Tax=Novosphingobium sp. TaxID=1874826 RepID=UPI002B4A78BF|nr:hypothetical protein [Novosphingobium sp.]HKR91722.1 hypothetical protein [Novosphingobium sp.]
MRVATAPSFPRKLGQCVGLLLLLLLVGCSSHDEAPSVAAGDEHIACAVGGSVKLAEVCSVERSEKDGQLTLVVHHPDGAFRRFSVMTDGTGLAVADGAEPARTTLADGKLDVSVAADRYLFPVTAKVHDAR